jgi:predicted RNA-binding Zn ribbon-like protein
VLQIGVLQLHHPDGQTFSFEPGSLALAFAITGPGTGEGRLARFQTLTSPSDLDRWATAVVGVQGMRATDRDLAIAHSLQRAIWRVADALIDRRSVPAPDRGFLNELAEQPSLVPRLTSVPDSRWIGRQRASALLSTVSRDAIDVFGGPLVGRLKRCEGARCQLLFLDTSRPGRRRWCSMERCGNRAKVAAHRRRTKEIRS